MADNQLARNGSKEFDLFSDDDPLSELARIVGYDNRPAMQQLQELEKHRNAVQQDPAALNLEDELLREFESYDRPVVAPPVESVVASPVEAAPEDILSVAGNDAAWVEHVQAEAPAAVTLPEPEFHEEWNIEPELIAEIEPDVASIYSEPLPADDAFASMDLDLERELELSIGYDDEPALEAVQPANDISYAPAAVFEEPSFTAVASPEISESAPQMSDHRTEAFDSHVSGADLVDSLLADIERFPVPSKPAATPQAAVRKNAYPFTPVFSRATPVASTGGNHKVYTAPIVAVAPKVVAAAPSLAQVEPLVELEAFGVNEPAVEVATSSPAPVAASAAEPDFNLDDFELDLSDIDLDLDPLELQALEQAEVAAPVATVSAPVEKIAPAPVETVAAKPVEYVRPEPVVETYSRPVVSAPIAEPDFALDGDQNDSELPFDPAMIAEAEESLTAIAELDVPQLPVIEQEKPVAYQPDYELDIDAEMAQLFGTAARSARNVEHGHDEHLFAGVQHPAAASVAKPAPRVEDDFDAFEKAMEEDFRQSLSPRQETDPASDRLAVGSGYVVGDDYADERRTSGVRRIALLAATVAGIAILGGAGVYAWMGGSAPGMSGGDPKVILADKTPVKIVPVEKGGKTVPNQDKAVYDRVAGAANDAPQQGALVSSTEEPIDVVQRTLTPEELPLEGRADETLPGVMAKDDDERLAPDTEVAAANGAATDDNAPAVSPRKVRTMIVKPDGTLVAREDIAPATETAQAEPVVTPVKTTTITQENKAPRSALAEAADVKVEETAPVRPVETTAVTETAALPQARPAVEQQPAAEQTASTPKVETPAPAQTTVAPGSYVIQIASLPSEAEAQKSYNTLSGKFSSVIGGKGVDIKKAEIAGKGTYFRVRIPAGSKDEANALCSRYKSAGGSCLVTR